MIKRMKIENTNNNDDDNYDNNNNNVYFIYINIWLNDIIETVINLTYVLVPKVNSEFLQD